jgi:hypothetical protein
MRFSTITKAVLTLINMPQSHWWHGSGNVATTNEPATQSFWIAHGIKVNQV